MTRHRRERRARRGMTLMELIVSLVVLALAATIGAGAFESLIDHRRIVSDATVSTERAAALREMVRDWLAAGSVQIQRGGGPNLGRTSAAAAIAAPTTSAASTTGTVTTAAQGIGDDITFTTSAPSPAMQQNVRIRLYIDADPATPEKGLSIEFQPNTATPLQRRMLDSSVDSMTVEYLDRRTNRWYGASQAATITPRAVRVTLLGTEGKNLPRLLQVPIVLPIGNTATLTGQGLASGGGQ